MHNSTSYIAYSPVYAHPLPEGHRFPMLKYELIPQQLLHEGTIEAHNLFVPGVCADDVILLAHTNEYLRKLKEQTLTVREQRAIGFLQSPLLTNRELIITKGTIDCCNIAMEEGIALNVAGGTHHAFANRGEGFCLLNDFAVAANYLLSRHTVKKILIVDLDVHQGNGTASIFQLEKRVFTFSMHGAHNYPFQKEKSDLDIALKDGTDDTEYLPLLEQTFKRLLNEVKPDFVFYQSGVDVLETDKFGKLKLTLRGCKRRDEIVFSALKTLQIPCVTAMGGGYSPDVKIIMEAHCNTFRAAKEIYGLD